MTRCAYQNFTLKTSIKLNIIYGLFTECIACIKSREFYSCTLVWIIVYGKWIETDRVDEHVGESNIITRN